MRNFYLFIGVLFLVNSSLAQSVFSVDHVNQAELKVYVVDYPNQADLLVYKVDYQNQAIGNKGCWFFVKYSNQAKKKLFFVKYANQADLKICFVKHMNQAGWKNEGKKYLIE
jgi:hypothetical protein